MQHITYNPSCIIISKFANLYGQDTISYTAKPLGVSQEAVDNMGHRLSNFLTTKISTVYLENNIS